MTFQGVHWLTVPIRHVRKFLPINEVRIANVTDPDWARRHWLTLKHNYSRAPFWKKFSGFFEKTFSKKWSKLVDLNVHLIRGLMDFFRIKTPLVIASILNVSGKKNDLIIRQCKKLGAKAYLSGKGALNYLDVEHFKKEGIQVIFQDFCHPIYPQLAGNFVSNLSAVDFLFWTGGKP
jgi:hypothetical protein